MAQPSIDTGTKQVGNGAGVNPVGFGYYPPEGSRVCNVAYNWNALTFYREDLSNLKALGFQTTIQSVFVDNSLNPNPVTIQVDSTEQVIIVPSYSQGIFPIFFGENAGYWISTTGNNNVATKLIHLNVPANTAGIWSVNPAGSVFDGNGNVVSPLIGTSCFQGVITTSGSTVIIPAVSGQRFFISSIKLNAFLNTTVSTNGYTTCLIQDGSNTIIEDVFYFSTAGATTYQLTGGYIYPGLNYISTAANRALNINLSVACLTGGVGISVFGGYTTQSP